MRPFRFARILGVDVIGDASLFGLALLLSWVLYLELSAPSGDLASGPAVVGALVGGVLFIATVLAHEISHTAVAQRRGLEVTRIRLMIFGGASELAEEATSPETEAVVAVVGPVTSAVLGGVFFAVSGLLPEALGSPLRFVGLANIALAGFNILPGLPLDGGRVLRAILWRATGDRDRATRMALASGRFFGLGMVVVGAYLMTLTGLAPAGIWVILVGWFLTRMVAAADRSHRLEVATRDQLVADVMRPVTESVSGSKTVTEAADLHQVGPRLRTLVVEVAGRVVGTLGQREVDGVEAELRDYTQVGAAMTRIGPADVVAVDERLMKALQREDRTNRHMVVVADGRVVGLIGPKEIGEVLAAANRPPVAKEDH